MNEKIVIGKKLTRGDVIISFIVITLMPMFMLTIIAATIFPSIEMSQTIKIVIIISVFLLSWILLVPMIGGTQRIEISTKEVIYYHVKGMRDQFKEVIRVLIGNKEKYNFKLQLENMSSVTLSYRITMGGYGLRGYTIMLGFVMKDNTVVRFTPFDIAGGGNHNKEYLKSLKILENNGVKVIDKFELRNILSLTESKIMDYLNELEVEKVWSK